MAKRPNPSGTTASRNSSVGPVRDSPSTPKRLRTSVGAQPLDHKMDTNPDTNALESVERNGSKNSTLRRDEDYYFTDGSVVLRIEDTLFKVHTSQLGAHSNVFKNMFTTLLTSDAMKLSTEGSCDESPIVVPDIKTPQFRSFLAMFYRPPSDDFFTKLQICEGNDEDAWTYFRFYLDVASLSQRFELPNMEQWASAGLTRLLHTNNIALHSKEDADDAFLEALEYSKTKSISMMRDVRNLFQCHWYHYDWDNYPMERFAIFFNTPGLSQKDPSMFGFLFLFLLSFDWKYWDYTSFTKANRTALYFARVRLVPMPSELKEKLHTPLFSQPASATDFLNALWSSPTHRGCNDKCRNNAFQEWVGQFDDAYYEQITRGGLDGLRALGSLPEYRALLVESIRTYKCPQDCSELVIQYLDEDIERMYKDITSYYQEIK